MAKHAARLLLVEPFYGGSHKQLIDVLHEKFAPYCVKHTMTAKKWHWRARTSALHFSTTIPVSTDYRTLFCSSVLNLAELVALRPDLGRLQKVLYFHENQLNYPVRKDQDRDFQYGYNQILSCLVADVVLFNSKYNLESFLGSINSFCNNMPDYRPKNLDKQIRPKCQVLHFPIQFPEQNDPCGEKMDITEKLMDDGKLAGTPNPKKSKMMETGDDSASNEIAVKDKDTGYAEDKQGSLKDKDSDKVCVIRDDQISKCLSADAKGLESNERVDNTRGDGAKCVRDLDGPLHIVWPHRWEHDKNPDLFFSTLFKLKENGFEFRLSVLGERYSEVPGVFDEAEKVLKENILHWGHLPSKQDYYDVLRSSDVVVSTANHEFFGVAMLEAVHLGAYPICPNALVYPEIFPKDSLYSTDQQLYKKLKKFCENPSGLRKRSKKVVVDTKQYSWDALSSKFKDILMPSCS